MDQERLTTIYGYFDSLRNATEELLEAGDIPATLQFFADTTTELTNLTKEIAIEAVAANILTHKRAADTIGVHPHTISRWLTAQAAEAPGTPPSDQGHHPAT